MSSFADTGISPELVANILKLGFETPTEIQSEAIPILLEGDTDLVGLAQTGTGKTAAFGLPMIDLVDTKSKVTQALVIAPTRELCMQITKELDNFSSHIRKMRIVPVYGGADIRTQIKKIRDGAQIIVATPGRLKDLINRRVVDLTQVQYVVLDEADEMLNMGFQEDIDEILVTTPDDKNVWLFSATMPKEVARIAKNYMRNPQEISSGEKNSSNKNISHQYLVVTRPNQYPAMRRMLDADPGIFGLVFCRTRRDTKELADKLTNDGYNADALHGDLSQAQRDRVMEKFRKKRLKILCATDVAARGIDVNDITHVFNFNIPDDLAFYTHRSGRTGRAGKKGVSIILLSPREKSKLRRLEHIIQARFEMIELPDMSNVVKNQLKVYLDKWKDAAIHKKAEKLIDDLSEELKDFSKDEIIAKAISLSFEKMFIAMEEAKRPQKSERRREDRSESYGRGDRGDRGGRRSDRNSYGGRSDRSERRSDRRSERSDRNRGEDRSERKNKREDRREQNSDIEGAQRMFINLGSMDFESKKDLVKVIAEYGGVDANDINEVNISKRNSFFTIEKGLVKKISSRFKDAEYKGHALRVNPDGIPSDKKKKKKDKKSYGKSYDSKDKKGGSKKGNFAKKKKAKKRD